MYDKRFHAKLLFSVFTKTLKGFLVPALNLNTPDKIAPNF